MESYDYNFEFSKEFDFIISIFNLYISYFFMKIFDYVTQTEFLKKQNIDKRERLFDTLVDIFLREEEGWSDNMAEIARRLRCGWRLRMLTGAEGAGRRKYSLM